MPHSTTKTNQLGQEEGLAHSLDQRRATLEQLQATEEALREQNVQLEQTQDLVVDEKRRYEQLFELAPDAYLVTDMQGTLQEVTRAGARLLGAPARFLIDKPLILFVVEADRAAFHAGLSKLAQGKRTTDWELGVQPRRGRAFDAALSVTAVPGAGGEAPTLRWLVRNISRRVAAERQVRELNAVLERRVAERTAELEEANRLTSDLLERERAAREVAEAANRAKDEFLAIVSHELRTPLNAMSTWLYMLRSGRLETAETERAQEVIERNLEVLTKLIDDLLDVSQIVAGKVRLQLRPVDPRPVLEAALDTVRPAAIAKSQDLEARLDTEVGQVATDPDRLQQIALNLLSNAIKFTPAGGRVEVRLSRSGTPEAPWAELVVRDTGQGIPPAFLPFVFDRFRQAEGSRTRVHGGMGLGLAIVRHLVELHGGKVEAFSAGVDQGATFKVALPIVRPSSHLASEGGSPSRSE
jgi:PAS domain S-box-containing protein